MVGDGNYGVVLFFDTTNNGIPYESGQLNSMVLIDGAGQVSA